MTNNAKALRRKAHAERKDNRNQSPRPSVARAERKKLMRETRQAAKGANNGDTPQVS